MSQHRDRDEWNRGVIAEFRANGGKVGGPFEGAPMVLLHTTGAKTGQERVNPVVYQAVGDDVVVFASKAGAPEHPDWYRNLMAHPDTTIELGTETVSVHARTAEGEERQQIWTKQKERMPQFADYEQKTAREIPVVVLERR
jgi:deazaflavin-dependent oxidoreductase (nitroreductase family)